MKAFFIMFEELSLKQIIIKKLDGESLTLSYNKADVSWLILSLPDGKG